MNIPTVRTAFKTALASLSTIRVEDTVPDSLQAPCVVVYPETVRYDAVYEGLADAVFCLKVLVPAGNSVGGQNLLDALLDPTGSSSVPGVMRSHANLGGAVSSTHVTEMRNYGTLDVGPQRFFTAELLVDIYE